MTSLQYHTAMACFSQKHGGMLRTETSDMRQSQYTKIYTYADGAQWIEHLGMADVLAHVVDATEPIKLNNVIRAFRCEGWNTDGDEIMVYYERS